MLLVITLLALMTAMALPLASRWLDGAAERGAIADLRAALRTLPAEAMLSGRRLRIDGPALALVANLPEAYGVALDPPLVFNANGTTPGGTLRLLLPDGRTISLRVASPFGEIAVSYGS
jgi:type II secretory pathway pseudopilin PulG